MALESRLLQMFMNAQLDEQRGSEQRASSTYQSLVDLAEQELTPDPDLVMQRLPRIQLYMLKTELGLHGVCSGGRCGVACGSGAAHGHHYLFGSDHPRWQPSRCGVCGDRERTA